MKLKFTQSSWVVCLLLGTVLTGLILRWQLAGTSFDWAISLDWRRAHSHLGFYGVLFPLSWICLKLSSAWVPGRRTLGAYYLLVAAAGISFLLQGYGFFSIAASTGILIVWLIFAWQNWDRRKICHRSWKTPISVSVFLSSLLIFAVAFLTRTQPALAQQFARAFLTLLLFGVFTPSVLRLFQGLPPYGFLWIVSTICCALFLTKMIESPFLGAGPLFLSLFISKVVLSSPIRDFRLKLAWILFSVGLGLSGLNLIPYSYHQAIAGIHFLVLGPLLMTFALIRLQLKIRGVLRFAYELSLGTMIFGIAVQEYTSQPLHPTVAWSATCLIAILFMIAVDFGFSGRVRSN